MRCPYRIDPALEGPVRLLRRPGRAAVRGGTVVAVLFVEAVREFVRARVEKALLAGVRGGVGGALAGAVEEVPAVDVESAPPLFMLWLLASPL